MNLAILQARMSSSRLPGKVLADVLGKPMVARQVERLSRAHTVDRLVLATSREASDDPLAEWADSAGVTVFRGALDDVLGRFCAVLEEHPETKAVIRLTADCPLADPSVIDDLVRLHHQEDADYSSNVLPDRTFPHGLDAEVVRPAALIAAGAEAREPYEREHVTPFIHGRPERFRQASLTRAPSWAHLRWTVDLPEDLVFVREVYAALHPENPRFTSEDVAGLPRNSAPIP